MTATNAGMRRQAEGREGRAQGWKERRMGEERTGLSGNMIYHRYVITLQL